ncbi:MAG: ABC transporter permease [Defluviitaleaceae bacterium]|nr:ABC transporter permease [Defluviitaleaceae bacterium]
MLILKNYLLRAYRDKTTIIMMLIFPCVLIAIMTFVANSNAEGTYHIIEGYNRFATSNLLMNVLLFQFLSGLYLTDFMYADFRSDMRWRLLAAPASLGKYVFNACIANVIIALVNSAVILVFGYFVLDAHLSNFIMVAAPLFTFALFLTLLGMLLFMLIPKKSTTTALFFALAFGQILPFQFGLLTITGGTLGFGNFLPIVAALNAIEYASNIRFGFADGSFYTASADMRGALIHLGILAGYTLIAALAVIIVGRKKPI